MSSFETIFLKSLAYARYSIVYANLALARVLRKRAVILAGTPSHQNIGDRAISVAERQFIKRFARDCIRVELRLQTNSLIGKIIPKQLVRKDDVFLLQGGGNFGDVYQEDIEFRMAIIERFFENRIILFPQTMNFMQENGNREYIKHQEVFSRARQLVLCAREEVSYGLMKESFPAARVLLVPDIVLSMAIHQKESGVRDGLLFVMRADREKLLSDLDTKRVADLVKGLQIGNLKRTDTIAPVSSFWSSITPDTIMVGRKLREFCEARLVVTDRLHGMIFAAITHTPVVAFSNTDWKVKGVYQWISHYTHVEYCDSVEQLPVAVERALGGVESSRYNRDYFNDSWRVIADEINAAVK